MRPIRKLTIVGPGKPYDLIAISLVVVFSVALSQLAIDSPLLWVLAFFSVYFAPGYALTSLLFPGNRVLLLDSLLIKRQTATRQVTGLERIALSFILSITVVAVAGVILLRSLLDLTPTSVGLELLAITLGVSILAYYARTRLPRSSQLEYSIALEGSAGKLSVAEKVIVVVIAVGVMISAIAVAMGLGGLRGREPYTEFYITGPGGDIARLPSVLVVEENGTVMMNIVNHEGRPTTYNLTLGLSNDSSFSTFHALNWEGNTSLAPEEGHYAQIGLQDDRSVELNFTFSVSSPGEYRLHFQIKNGDSSKELWIWLDIIVPD